MVSPGLENFNNSLKLIIINFISKFSFKYILLISKLKMLIYFKSLAFKFFLDIFRLGQNFDQITIIINFMIFNYITIRDKLFNDPIDEIIFNSGQVFTKYKS